MERTCSQTVKIPFPAKVFYGTEVSINIPKSGDFIKNVKLVVEFPNSVNTLGERIVEKAEIISSSNSKSLETLYGEYIHVRNSFVTPSEKRTKLSELLCTSSPGNMYLELPFHLTSDGLFLVSDDLQLRILFSSVSNSTDELKGYVLIDYYVIEPENFPKFPYVQRTTQVQRFTRTCTSPKSIKMAVYAVGSVYQLYFTVKDTSTKKYVDALSNVRLYFGEKERFNLTGKYLRNVEPIKVKEYSYSEPMYMYNFCVEPSIPSGSTHFPENTVFLLDFYNNDKTYEVTIWAKSHDFVYFTKDTIRPIFESTEILLDTTCQEVSGFSNVPMRISYINYSESAVIFYSSDYEITNISIDTTVPSDSVSQNQNVIEFRRIDSLLGEYTANVTFSSQGFSDTVCYFRIRGNNIYPDEIYYSSNGNYPTHIDLGQNFHYILGNVFNFSNTVFTSNIQSLSFDENKNYAFTTFSIGTCNILGSGTPFNGPGSVLAKYDKDMNMLFTVNTANANTTPLATGNTYGIYGENIGGGAPSGRQGLIVSRDYAYSLNINAGTANVFIDGISIKDYDTGYATIRFSSSSSNAVIGSISTNFGLNTERCCLVGLPDGSILTTISSVANGVNSSVDYFSNGQPVWAFMFTSSSTSSGTTSTNIPSSSNGYFLKTYGWSKAITNITSSSLKTKLKVDSMTRSVYLLGGYDSTTPSLTGYTFTGGTGFFAIKFDSLGNTKYVISFIGSIIDMLPVLDVTTGRFMVSVTTQISSLLSVYNNGSLIYRGAGRFQFFIFDDYGNLNSGEKDLNELFGIAKPTYFTPLCTSEFFNEYTKPVPSNTIWNCFLTGTSQRQFSGFTVDKITNDVYALVTSVSGFSNITDKYGDTGASFTNVGGSPMTAHVLKLDANCTYSSRLLYATFLRDSSVSIFSKSTSIYALLNTSANQSALVYNKNGGHVLTSPSIPSDSLLLLKFNTDGTYANWYMTIENSTGTSIIGDSSGNTYINATKLSTSALNIKIQTSTVGTVPSTSQLPSCFVVKISNSDTYSSLSYIDGCQSCISTVDGNGNLFLSGNQNASVTSYINGISVATVPSKSKNNTFIVKFNPNGTYANWYAQLFSSESECYKSQISKTSTNAPVWYVLLGGVGLVENRTFDLYINGVFKKSMNNQRAASNCLIKFTPDTNPDYDWIVRGGVDPNSLNNFTFGGDLIVDRTDNFIVSSTRQPYAYYIYDSTVTQTGFPGTPTMVVPASCYQSGLLFKVNSDGTVNDNNYIYIDSTGDFDSADACSYDNNGDVYVIGKAGNTSKYFSVFDKNGYAGVLNAVYDNVNYGYLLKINANMLINKISL